MRSAHRLTLVTILALCPVAHADTIFNFSATINSIPGPSRGYPPTSPATGIITIDTVQGIVTGASIQTFATSFDFVNFTFSNGSSVEISLTNQKPPFTTPPFNLFALDILLPVNSLVGYTGGPGCSLTYEPASCLSPSAISNDGPTAAFADTLSLTPAVAQTPELNSLVLLGTGLLGLTTAIRSRHRPSAG